MIHRFAIRHHKLFVLIFIASAALFVSGCGGSIAGDAENVLAVISLGLATLSGALAFIPGGTVLSAAVGVAEGVVTQLQTEFKTWQANPTESTFQNLMSLVNSLTTNLNQILAGTGLPAAAITKIQSIVTAIQTQITSWVNLISSLKGGSTTSAAIDAETPGTELHDQLKQVHEASKEFHGQLKAIVDEPTGDAEVDEAFQKANKL
jgi:hypothetical protein